MAPRSLRGFASLAALSAVASCASPEPAVDDRQAQLELFFSRTLSTLARSRPHQLRLRFDVMSASPFKFLRGTEGLYWRDIHDPTMSFGASTLTAPDRLLLQGDAHTENIGTFSGATVELNDFDAAAFGRPHWEVVRAGASLAVALRETNVEADEASLVRALADAYAAAITQGDASALGAKDVGAIVGKRLASATKDAAARSELVDFTVVAEGRRSLKRGGTDPADPSEALLTVGAAVTDALPQALARYTATLQDTRWPAGYFDHKDVARRCGQGVGSLTAVRLYVLIEGPTASPDDDVIIQLKEGADAALDADLAQRPPADDAAARVVSRQRRLQSTPTADPRLGHTRLLDLPFVVTTISGAQKTVRITDLAGRAPADLQRFAVDFGTTLARAHLRGVTIDGNSARELLRQWIGGREQTFADETTAAARAYATLVVADHARFRDLRERFGPTLGLTRVIPPDAPIDDPARAVLDPPCP